LKRVGVDIGGTFTDLIAYDERTHRFSRAKVLSTPHAPEQGALNAVRTAGIEPEDISYLIHGTTIVTNLILERNGARVGLITTEGFRDVLEIMRASRPRPYDLSWKKPEPIVPRHLRLEVRERVNYRGEVLTPLDTAQAEDVVRALVDSKVDAIAVCFLHSYANPSHERQMSEIIRRVAPGVHVTISSDVCREIREYERTSTAVLNAYAAPRIHEYIGALESQLSVASGIRYMNSEGGVIPASEAKRSPVTLALSGPAGGVLAGQFLGRMLGLADTITMDMGGTSLDVCVIQDEQPQIESSLSVEWGIPIWLRAVQIKTIGAGGGSVVWVDDGNALQIGPESAGASPGPACYGRGGDRATVTDANMMLGLLNPDYFLGGEFGIDYDRAVAVMQPIADHFGISLHQAAEGVYRVVNAKVAQAIRQITVEKGIDPRAFTLISFGGAGGQHAVAVAREASIRRVILPVMPSVFSALGMITADVRTSRSRTVIQPLDTISMETLEHIFQELEAEGRAVVEVGGSDISVARALDLRYQSQSHELSVAAYPNDTPSALYSRFEDAHQRLYASKLGDPVDVISLRSTVIGHIARIAVPRLPSGRAASASVDHRMVYPYPQSVPVFRRDELGAHGAVPTPCIIEETDTTHFLPDYCRAEVDDYGNVVIELEA